MKLTIIKVSVVLFVFIALLSACTDKEAQQAVKLVEDTIAGININDVDEDTVENARSLYDALEDKLKAKVTNYDTLTHAEEILKAEKLESLLIDIHTTLNISIIGCESLRHGIVTAWDSAIHTDGADFNDALTALFNGERYSVPYSSRKVVISTEYAANFVAALEMVKTDYADLETMFKELSALDVDDTIYNSLLDLYSKYVVLYNQVTSPSGSYVSFTSSTNEAIDDVEQAEALLDVVWPYD